MFLVQWYHFWKIVQRFAKYHRFSSIFIFVLFHFLFSFSFSSSSCKAARRSAPSRYIQEKLKRREKLDKRKAEDPDLPSYSESRKRIKNVYVEKIKSPINIGKGISINTILLIFWVFCLTYNLRVLPYGFCPFKSNISRPFLAYACTYCTLHCALIVLT